MPSPTCIRRHAAGSCFLQDGPEAGRRTNLSHITQPIQDEQDLNINAAPAAEHALCCVQRELAAKREAALTKELRSMQRALEDCRRCAAQQQQAARREAEEEIAALVAEVAALTEEAVQLRAEQQQQQVLAQASWVCLETGNTSCMLLCALSCICWAACARVHRHAAWIS